MNKKIEKIISISQLAKKLNLINLKNKKPQNYILRYWEKEFKEINPKIINKRRYYTGDQVKINQLINFLLKDKEMTISGVKKVLKSKINKLDDHNSYSLKADYYKKIIKEKTKNIQIRVTNLKKYGKKVTHKS